MVTRVTQGELPSKGILACGPDCLMAIYSFVATFPQWVCLQRVCRSLAVCCRLPSWVGLLRPLPRSMAALLDTLNDLSMSVESQTNTLRLVHAFTQGSKNKANLSFMAERLTLKLKVIVERAIVAGDLGRVQLCLQTLSPNAEIEDEPLIFLALRSPSNNIFSFLVEQKADVSQTWGTQSLASRLGLGCAWPIIEKRAVFDMLRQSDEIYPELEAATTADQAWLERLVAEGVTFRADRFGFTALHYASSSNQSQIAKWLLQNNILQADELSLEGFTPLGRAARNGHLDMIKVLIEHAADVNKCASDRWTPLLVAASEGREQVIELLLEAKAAVNHLAIDNFSALFLGVQCSSFNICRNLLQAGASVHLSTNKGWHPLHRAAVSGNEDIINLLIASNADVDAKDNMHWTPLFLAVQERKLGVAELLLKHRATVDHQSDSGRTPIQIALLHGSLIMVQCLLRHGADVNQCDSGSKSLLFIALETTNPDVALVKTLLENKAKIDHVVSQGPETWQTPLDLVVGSPNMRDIARLLLDGNYTNDLSVAVVAGDLASVRRLLDTGVKPLIKPDMLLSTAAAQGNVELMRLLLNFNRCPTELELCSALNDAAFLGHLQIVQMLMEAKASPEDNRQGLQGDTPLLCTAANGHNDVVEYLLSQKANVDYRVGFGWTPLMGVAWRGHVSTLELLLEAKADVHCKSLGKVKEFEVPKGVTALWLAVRENHVNVVSLLIDANADVHEADDKQNTPLHIAALRGHKDSVKMLLDAGAQAVNVNRLGKTPLQLAVEGCHKDVMEILTSVASGL